MNTVYRYFETKNASSYDFDNYKLLQSVHVSLVFAGYAHSAEMK